MFVGRFIGSLYMVIGALHVVSGGIGGQAPKDNDGGFVAYIYHGGVQVAMGVLVDRRWVITVAFYVPTWQTYMVKVGNGEDGQMDTYYVEDVVHHPNFTGGFTNDVALLRLSSPARVGQPHINVVDGVASLDVANKIKHSNRRCFYYVKGVTRNDASIFKDRHDLAKISTRYIRCKNDFKIINTDPFYKNQLACTKSNQRQEVPCMDNAAPLLCRHHGKWLLTGMYGAYDNRNECHFSEIILTEVGMHKPWVLSIIE